MIPAIAVLGAAGFIGNRTVEMLHLGGRHVVRPVVRRPQALALPSRFAVEGRVADARDEAALAAAFAGCSHVVHAIAGDPKTIVDTIAPVYRAATIAGVRRVVYLSSASVHGQSPATGTNEASPLSDRQPVAYNNAKVEAERRLEALRQGGVVEVVRLRPGIVHGPRSQWTGGFADELLAGDAYLVGGGRGICNAVYVDNLVQAIGLALEVPGADGKAFLVGDTECITWAELCRPLAEALQCDLEGTFVPVPTASGAARRRGRASAPIRAAAALLPRRGRRALKAALAELRSERAAAPRPGAVVSEERVALHTCQVRLPTEKARRELGYRPTVNFEAACRHAVAWLAFAGYPVVGEALATRLAWPGRNLEAAQP
jgi:nucleoside-diphosphate-sugar epimerase